MKIAWFDAFSGISGDMTVGALLDLGVPLEAVEAGLAPLGVEGFHLATETRVRSGITATKFIVHVHGRVPAEGREPGAHPVDGSRRGRPQDDARGHEHDHGVAESGHGHDHDHGVGGSGHGHDAGHGQGAAGSRHSHRRYRDIRALLDRSPLAPGVRDRAQRIFRALAIAEGRIHGIPPDEVGFHEVGAIDAVVDVVGTAICLDHLGVERIHVSPLPLGSGFVRAQHGVLPVPPPAAIELLRGFPVRPGDGGAELVTPTGAAIVAALATPDPVPDLIPSAIGYGAGDRELPDRPNLLRVVLGEERHVRPAAAPGAGDAGLSARREEMVVLEANIDDMNPEFYAPAVEALFAAGARDVTLAPITMKKGRPGTLLQVIGEPGDRDRLAGVLLRETSTIGVRTYTVERLTLPRTVRTVPTPFGPVPVKVVRLPDGTTRAAPEFEDCRRIARERGVPISTVHEAAVRSAGDLDRG